MHSFVGHSRQLQDFVVYKADLQIATALCSWTRAHPSPSDVVMSTRPEILAGGRDGPYAVGRFERCLEQSPELHTTLIPRFSEGTFRTPLRYPEPDNAPWRSQPPIPELVRRIRMDEAHLVPLATQPPTVQMVPGAGLEAAWSCPRVVFLTRRSTEEASY